MYAIDLTHTAKLIIDHIHFSGGVIASAIIGLSRGCLVTSMAIVTIKLLDVTRFSTGLGLTFGLVGLITTVTGPLYGKFLAQRRLDFRPSKSGF